MMSRLAAKKTPPTMVIGSPLKKLNIVFMLNSLPEVLFSREQQVIVLCASEARL
jgi:hypothetical protein